MANYASYKTISNDQIVDNSITNDQLAPAAFSNWCVKWIYGSPGALTGGCCCLWTVPSGVSRVTFDLWGAGGNGHGTCSCNRCYNWHGAGGGFYNTKTIDVQSGWTYTICAGGVYPCCAQDCVGCDGCTTYINGCNLSNFCALGGARGCAVNDWSVPCYSTMERCCVQPGAWGGDFAMGNHVVHSPKIDGWDCHCYYNQGIPTGAPFIGTLGVSYTARQCWVRCGCWTVPYGHGGQGAITTYCERCCGQGGTGGSGLVKITMV